jgi:hypothetical protein
MKWPTLKGRLEHPLKTEEEALLQLKQHNIPMSEDAKKKLEQYERKRQTKKDAA